MRDIKERLRALERIIENASPRQLSRPEARLKQISHCVRLSGELYDVFYANEIREPCRPTLFVVGKHTNATIVTVPAAMTTQEAYTETFLHQTQLTPTVQNDTQILLSYKDRLGRDFRVASCEAVEFFAMMGNIVMYYKYLETCDPAHHKVHINVNDIADLSAIEVTLADIENGLLASRAQ